MKGWQSMHADTHEEIYSSKLKREQRARKVSIILCMLFLVSEIEIIKI